MANRVIMKSVIAKYFSEMQAVLYQELYIYTPRSIYYLFITTE